ncbi:DUF1353 domain-containing protein [Neptuniibacter sp. QD72_48]|uniref:DUF1353 domain-containing protein n=1 Tax=unclassified Neptuniibacter TaxID=2630693 RepID=UPI0039F5E935
MNMPTIRPLPIKTKNESLIIRILRWIFAVRKWVLTEDWTYTMRDGTKIVIPKGFEFDGASIPRPLWAILSPTGLLFLPGLIHDYAYKYDQLIGIDENGKRYAYKAGAGKSHWDRVFRETGIDINGVAIIDTLAWLALALGGWYTWRQHRKTNAQPVIEQVAK